MNDLNFTYTYSATESEEVNEIKRRYLPKEENKLEEIKRLDRLVQNAGIMQSLIIGIGSCLIFGAGLCFALKVLSGGLIIGVPLGLIGTIGMFFAYPVYRTVYKKTKDKYTPRILELANELENN